MEEEIDAEGFSDLMDDDEMLDDIRLWLFEKLTIMELSNEMILELVDRDE